MLKEVIATGKSIDAAVENGCLELGKDKDDVQYEIIDMPEKGIFGKIKKEAQVKVFYDDGKSEPKPARAETPARGGKPFRKERKSEPRKTYDKPREKTNCTPEIAEKKVEAGKKYIEDIISN